MSIYGTMRTGVSGMAAQANRIGVVADNMANVNTTGYKRSSTQFSSFILNNQSGSYNSGGVETHIRQHVTQQGALQYTTSTTDLAVNGNGFFIVSDTNGTPFLTRAGSFVPDGEGNLINAGGFQLMGYPLADGNPNVIVNSMVGLSPVNISQNALEATPSTQGAFAANLPSGAEVGDTFQSSLLVFDYLGNPVKVDFDFVKTNDNEWSVTATDTVYGGVTTDIMTFDPLTGGITPADFEIVLPEPPSPPAPLNVRPEITFSHASMTQVAADYTVMRAEVNGNAPSAVRGVEFGSDGTLYAVFENGDRRATHRIPLADVRSPDNLVATAGNVYSVGINSGDVTMGFPGEGGMGTMVTGALEQSNVDLADELTNMIEAQRGYQANSKVFQTGSDLLEVLVNLKR